MLITGEYRMKPSHTTALHSLAGLLAIMPQILLHKKNTRTYAAFRLIYRSDSIYFISLLYLRAPYVNAMRLKRLLTYFEFLFAGFAAK